MSLSVYTVSSCRGLRADRGSRPSARRRRGGSLRCAPSAGVSDDDEIVDAIEPAFDLLADGIVTVTVTGLPPPPPPPRRRRPAAAPPPTTQAFCSCTGSVMRHADAPASHRSPSGRRRTSRRSIALPAAASPTTMFSADGLGPGRRIALAAHRRGDAVDVLGDRLHVVVRQIAGSGGIGGMPGFCRPLWTTGRISSPF